MTLGATAVLRTESREAANVDYLATATWVTLGVIVAGFAWWYGRILFQLPIFGDATEHARISRSFIEDGILNTASSSPPLYHIFGAIGLQAGGEDGFIAVTVISLVALGFAVYCLAYEITSSRMVGLAAAILAYLSPKTAFYSGRLYMEIPLTVFFVVTFLFLHRYLRTSRRSDLMMCAIAASSAALTKQQGLVLLALPLAAFLPSLEVWRAARTKRMPQLFALAAVPVVVLSVMTPVLLWQIRNTGRFLPESDYTTALNDVARSVTGYTDPDAAWKAEWDEYLEREFRDRGYLETGSISAESRHIWPVQAFTTSKGFYSVHSLFWTNLPGGVPLPAIETKSLMALFTLGFFLWAMTHRQRTYVMFFALFLIANYVAFIRNNDQMRYHLYIPYLLAFALPFVPHFLLSRLSRQVAFVGVASLLVVAGAFATRYLPDRTEGALKYWGTQAYAPSAGGIRAVQEASRFLESVTGPDERSYGVPGNEFAYYAHRKVIYDWRIFFLSKEELKRVIDGMAVKYIAIPDSAVLADDEWNHLAKAPQSFADKVASLYPLAFTTGSGDIRIYEVKD